MIKYIFFLVLCVAGGSRANSAGEPVLPWQPVVSNAVQEKYVASEQGQLNGLLNSRILLNLERRLLKIDSSLFLSGFEQRPGTQKWIGEHIGKFLFAAANTYRYTHSAALKALMDDVVRKYIATQLPDGYLGTYLPKDYWTEWDVWSHKYAIIGLLSYYSITGSQPALDAARKAGDLICRTFGNGPGQRDLNVSGYHNGMASGSILEAIVDLYRYTGDPKYLAFAQYILSNWESATGPKIISALEQFGKVTKVGNAKAYEMLSCFLGIIKYYKLTGDTRYLKAMQAAWQDIATNRLYITGTASSAEHFQDDQVLPASTEDKIGEGCVTTTWIQFNEQLLRITGDVKYATEIERALYNHLLAAENMETGCVSYYTPLQGAKPYKCRLTCCLSSVPRAISMIPAMVWGRINNEFSVLLYEAGVVTDSIVATDGSRLSLHVVATTTFPAAGDIVYKINPSAAKKFSIHFRRPDWADHYTIAVNGVKQNLPAGEMVRVERIWKANDKVVVHFELPLVSLPGGISYPGYVAYKRGPQILAMDSLLNPGYKEIIAALNGVKGQPVVADAGKSLPSGWVGRQAYRVTYVKAGKKISFILVPFADAGQQGSLQQVWMPVAVKDENTTGYPAGSSPREIGGKLAERFLSQSFYNYGRPGQPRLIFYPEACTWYGALLFAKSIHDQELTDRLVARFQPLLGDRDTLIPPSDHVDHTVFAAVPLELYLQTKDRRYLDIGKAMADKQWAEPEGKSLSQQSRRYYELGYTPQTRLWIDDMFMINAVQVQAYRATGDMKYINRAAKEMVLYLDSLQQPNGLFYHAQDAPFFWGRGNGWMAAGMTLLLRSLPAGHPDRPRILEGYRQMMAMLLKCQAEDGMWRQLVDDPTSWEESSGTGMFTFAFISGVKQGWLDKKIYGPAANRGWLALVKQLDGQTDVKNICEGTNKKNDRQYYLDRKKLTGDLHGQAPLLWCAAALSD